MKVLGTGWATGVGWRDVEVVRERGRPPALRLHGEAAALARRLRHRPVASSSLTHTRATAAAWVVAEGGRVTASLAPAGPARRGRRSSTATAQSPPTKPRTVQSVFGWPLLWAKSRHMIASQMWTISTVPSSVDHGSSGATKREPRPVRQRRSTRSSRFP